MLSSTNITGGSKAGDAQQRAKDIMEHEADIYYSPRYCDDTHEYRHVVMAKLGSKASQGWHHYMIHTPEPHILLYKRDK
ncbi:regulatory subunit of cyclin-dependent kinase [Chytridium lagenaria]|nr:regulatory subunit of cyclin-dependent kinase [Chytridium lagenaria]